MFNEHGIPQFVKVGVPSAACLVINSEHVALEKHHRTFPLLINYCEVLAVGNRGPGGATRRSEQIAN